jgi:hypothetical protein
MNLDRARLKIAEPFHSQNDPNSNASILLRARFLTVPLARQSFLHAAFFTWFQIEGMPLNLFDDILLLNFSFEAAQGAF